MIEILFGAAELGLGMAVGFAGARAGGRCLPIAIVLGTLVCAGIALYAAIAVNPCPNGADCEPTTWANWTFLGVALVGFWFLAVAMGYALSDRFRH
ncbi:MAG: hypothetical protein ABJB93_09640, partial [Gaiellales bacterium]